ncbi:lytic polysaccharide monooxygenase auxiliary activity family 9 protein [Rhodotorula paludigena]|uniref:lytic polysaccharide monooxygenase auxiliary activity family 9 protein n=1 Tax=Rhodotorula paludigena TaxID=86838 RepID=UPI00317C7A23
MALRASIFAALAFGTAQVMGHAYVTTVWVNGKDTWDRSQVGQAATYLRQPASNSPVTDLSSPNLACNTRGSTPVSGFLSVAPGDTIEPEWWHSAARGQDPIDGSHKGPLTTWIAPYSDGIPSGDAWVQIGSEAFHTDTNQWAVTKMIANRGRNTVKVPANLAPGRYLVRFDLLALHEGQSPGGAQFYPSCAQIEVTGSGSTALPSGVAIPGFYTSSTPGVVWIYYSSSYNVERDYVAPESAGTGIWDGTAPYSTATCREVVYGLAPAGYCQSGATVPPPSTSTSSSPNNGSSSA